MKKVKKGKTMSMPVWDNRNIRVEVKRIVILTCVRQIVEYGTEVWAPITKQTSAAIDCVQADIIKCAMHVGHERPWAHKRGSKARFCMQSGVAGAIMMHVLCWLHGV